MPSFPFRQPPATRIDRTALIAVDVQRDFIDGSLGGQTPEAVLERESVRDPLYQIARGQRAEYGLAAYQTPRLVIASRDWHPEGHVSFSDTPTFVDGGWPEHCVQNTPGAEIDPVILSVADVIVSKGTHRNQEEYSAANARTPSGVTTTNLLRDFNIRTVIVGGIAIDYCVAATALDLAREGFHVVVVEAASAGVAPDTTAEAIDRMRDAGVRVVGSAVRRS